MKSIILKITPYAIVFMLLNIACYKVSGFYKQQEKYIDRIETSIKAGSETVFLGDSHVETIKLLDLSENVGNLAFGADGIYEMYIKVLTMMALNPNLKQIFLATEPQMFNNTGSSNSTFLGKYLLEVNDTLEVYNKTKLNLLTDRVPLFNDSYIGYVLNEFYANFKTDSYKEKKDWSKLTANEREAIATATGISDHLNLMTNDKFLEAYEAIISICKKNNIKVIGVRFPVNEYYINQCNPIDRKKVDDFIASLKLDLHLDYSTLISDPNYFDDQDHLNQKGIEFLAEIIYHDTGLKITQ